MVRSRERSPWDDDAGSVLVLPRLTLCCAISVHEGELSCPTTIVDVLVMTPRGAGWLRIDSYEVDVLPPRRWPA
jgi:hypothetical protein